MIKIRGNRILFTPSVDAELPEGERRVFSFVNPSITSFDRLIESCGETRDGETVVNTHAIAHKLLRGWNNVQTDDVAVAAKYGVAVPEGETPQAIELPFPAASVLVDLHDILPLPTWRELTREVYQTISPVTSGN